MFDLQNIYENILLKMQITSKYILKLVKIFQNTGSN